MKFRKRHFLYLSYGVLLFLIIGKYWWSLPYEKLLMEQAMIRWSIFIFVASFAFILLFKLSPKKTILSSIIGLLAAVVVRIVHDKIQEPSTHNLLLIEIFMSVGIAGLSSGAGVYFASFFIKKKPESGMGKAEIEQTRKKDSTESE